MSSKNILEMLGLEDEVSAVSDEHLAVEPNHYIEEDKKRFTIHLEITVNLPLTARFQKLDYIQQVECYKSIWKKVMDSFLDENQKDNKFYIENTQRVFPHLHGYITLEFTHPIIPAGLVMDVSKVMLQQFTKGQFNKQFCKCNYNERLERFKSAGICVNFKRFLSDRWLTYISKSLLNKRA